MTRYANNSRLPRLDMPSEHERLREASPHDLRGAKYSKLQDTHRKDKVVILPVLGHGEHHPQPYYVTDEVTFPALTEVPWRAEEKNKIKEQKETFSSDKKAQHLLVDDLLDDAITEEIVSTASVVLEHNKYQEADNWRVAEVVEESIVMPGIQQEVWVVVWSLLYDLGRSLPDDQYLDLHRQDHRLRLNAITKQALLGHVQEGENWANDLREEKMLSEVPWDALVYHYHRNLLENGLAKNLALQIYQERVVTAAAGGEVVGETMKALESALTSLDEQEKVFSPPRQG